MRFFLVMIDERLLKALKEVGIEELTDYQKRSFKKVLNGKDVLIVAPTGSGKTEAAVIPILQELLRDKDKKGIKVLYITPLRALNRDMLRRLEGLAKKLGISIDVRHGDTSESKRVKQSKNPPVILITTPETFQILFLGKRLRKYLENVRYVVIDEVHELLDNKRGVQLSIALERLREITDFKIVALSATLSNGVFENFEVVRGDLNKEYEFQILKPERKDIDSDIAKELEVDDRFASELREIRDIMEKHRSILIFVNTRQTAEALGVKLKRIADVDVHHGSLSKESRIEAEKMFSNGKLKGLICTSSMELGIDIGYVDAVVQYNSPRQVTRLLQRVGRSGHRIGKVSKGYIIVSNFDEILESWVIAKRALEGKIEKVDIHFNSLDVLANQISAIALEYKRIEAEKVYRIIKRSYFYRNLSYEEFEEICKFLADIGLIGYNGHEIYAKRKTRLYFYENISMIPDEKSYRVVDITTNRTIGVLDESFVSTFDGEVFAMRGELWRILSIDDVVRVEPVSAEGVIPSWVGEEIPVPFEVAQDVGKLRLWIAGYITNGINPIKILVDEFNTNELTCKEVVSVIESHIKKGFKIPSDNHLTIESSDGITVVNACFGHKVNETIGRILALLISARKGRSISVEIDPYRIKLSPTSSEEVVDALRSVEPESIEFLVERALIETKLMQWKFVEIARRFGLIGKNEDLRRINVKNLILRLRDTPIYKETLRDIFTEKMDLETTKKIFERLDNDITYSVYSELSPISLVARSSSYDFITLRSDGIILKSFKERLEKEICTLYCLNCKAKYSLQVSQINSLECIRCKSRFVAVLKRDPKDYKKSELFRIANLIMCYGKRAVYALAAYGIGVETATRILARYYKNDDEFFKALLEAERNYVRTRRFWD